MISMGAFGNAHKAIVISKMWRLLNFYAIRKKALSSQALRPQNGPFPQGFQQNC